MKRTPVVVVAAILGALLAACGSATTSTTTQSPSATTVATTSPATPLTAAGMVAKLKGAGLPIGQVIVYTAATDVNHLLGRPNGYLSKAAFTDTRIRAADNPGYALGDIELGGGVEVFSDPSGAQARMKYLQAIGKAMPSLVEYDYVVGNALVRISNVLTPDQAAAYQAAAEK